MSDDSVTQLEQARNGVYSDAHPPLMSIIWRYMDMAIKGQTGMLILQNYLYWLGIALIFLPISNKIIYFLAVCIAGLFPPYFLLQGVIWKDNFMGGFLLCAIGFLVSAEMSRANSTGSRPIKSIILLIISIICVFFALMMRHNAIFAAFPLLYLVIAAALMGRDTPMRIVRLKPFALTGAATVASFLLVSVMTSALADRHARANQFIAAFDLVAVAARTGEPIFDEAKYPELKGGFSGGYKDPATILKTYNACDAFPTFVTHTWGPALWNRTDDPIVVKQAWLAWRDAVANHPVKFIKHKVRVFVCSLGFGNMGPWYAPIFFHVSAKVAPLGISYTGPSTLQKFVADQAWYLSQSEIYKVYIYFFISIVVCLIASLDKGYLNFLAFWIALSGIGYQFGYLIVGISTEFRYYAWMITCAIISTLLLIISYLPLRATLGTSPNSSDYPEQPKQP